MIAEEQVPLFIYNASDPESSLTRPFGQYQAFKNAVKLARFGFNIQDVQNAPEVSTGTILQIYGSGSSDATIA